MSQYLPKLLHPQKQGVLPELWNTYRYTLFYCAVLYWAYRYCILYKLNLRQHCWEQAHQYLLTSHSWNSFNISNLFITTIFLWWSVIGDLWCSFIIWGLHKSHPYKCAKSLQVCPTLWPMYWSPSGSSVHGLLHARILEGVVISFYRASSQPRDRILVSYFFCIGRKVLYH